MYCNSCSIDITGNFITWDITLSTTLRCAMFVSHGGDLWVSRVQSCVSQRAPQHVAQRVL